MMREFTNHVSRMAGEFISSSFFTFNWWSAMKFCFVRSSGFNCCIKKTYHRCMAKNKITHKMGIRNLWLPDTFKVAGTRRFISEELLKLQQSSRVIWHEQILYYTKTRSCVNRIGMDSSCSWCASVGRILPYLQRLVWFMDHIRPCHSCHFGNAPWRTCTGMLKLINSLIICYYL